MSSLSSIPDTRGFRFGVVLLLDWLPTKAAEPSLPKNVWLLRQGGQRKRWEDNIRAWTGLEFGKSQRAVENREKWRKLVAKSSVVPNDPRG